MKYNPHLPPMDPEQWILIKTKSGLHWQRRRGQGGKEVSLNAAFAEQVKHTKPSAKAAARLRHTLSRYTGRMKTGRFTMKVASLIRQAIIRDSWPDYGVLRNLAFQPAVPFDALLLWGKDVYVEEGQVRVRIPLKEEGAVRAKNLAVTRYRFALLLLAGDVMEEDAPLSTTLTESADYIFGQPADPCELSTAVPQDGRPWMVCLRLMSYEGTEVDSSGRHSGMKVVAWG